MTSASSRTRARAAMSFIEIAIVIAILATAIMGLVSSIFSLNQAQRFATETQTARELAPAMAERLQGINWQMLHATRDDPENDTFTRQPWSWHRRRDDTGLPPLTEDDNSAGGLHNLITTGLVDRPTGLGNLQVFVEYFDLTAMSLDTIGTLDVWQQRSSLSTNYWPAAEGWANQLVLDISNPPDVSFAAVEDGLMFHILLRWTSIAVRDVVDPVTLQPLRDRSLSLFLVRRR